MDKMIIYRDWKEALSLLSPEKRCLAWEALKDLLLERYSRQLFTIVTSNLKSAQMEEKYSTRITDRFREMMEVVNFKNTSYR